MIAPTTDQIIPLGQYLKKRMPPRVMSPGELITYSNNGMALAGYLVEVRSGMPYAQYIDQQILQPLAMHRSRAKLAPPIAEALATGYEYDAGSASFKAVPPVYFNASPAGSIYTTAEDMAHFMIAHLQRGNYSRETVLSETTALAMQQQQFTHDERIPGVCYAFFERYENGHRLLLHGGAIFGYFSFVFLIPDQNLGFFFSCNTFNPGVGEMSWQILSAFLDRYFSERQPVDEPTEFSPEELEQVVGHYQTTRYAQHSLIKIAALMGQVEVEATPEGDLLMHMLMSPQVAPWRRVGPLLFKQDLKDEYAAFRADEEGRITHLFMQNFAFERIPWYKTRSFQLSLLGFTVVMFLSASLSWPIGYMIRRWRARPRSNPRYATWARLLVGGISSLNLIFLIGLVINQDKLTLEIGFGIPTVIYALLLVALVAALLAILILPLTIVLWRDRVWSVAAMVHYSLVVLGIIVFILFLHYWNLLGVRE
jgi:CubicO group peptidase (beta-lactamase class C family)